MILVRTVSMLRFFCNSKLFGNLGSLLSQSLRSVLCLISLHSEVRNHGFGNRETSIRGVIEGGRWRRHRYRCSCMYWWDSGRVVAHVGGWIDFFLLQTCIDVCRPYMLVCFLVVSFSFYRLLSTDIGCENWKLVFYHLRCHEKRFQEKCKNNVIKY